MQFAPVTGGTAWSHDGFGFYTAQTGGSPILIYPHPATVTVNPGQYQIVNPARIAVNSVDCTTGSGVALNAAQVAALLGQGGNLVAAATGTNQATALLIGPGTTIFTNVASGTGTILSPALGVVFRLVNRGANPLLVYPPVGAAIDNNAANAAVMVAAMGTAEFLAVGSSQIYAF